MPQKTGAVQNKLEEELQRILTKLGLNLDLRVVWTPDPPNSFPAKLRATQYTFTKLRRKRPYKPPRT
jgi:hypothetical protein